MNILCHLFLRSTLHVGSVNSCPENPSHRMGPKVSTLLCHGLTPDACSGFDLGFVVPSPPRLLPSCIDLPSSDEWLSLLGICSGQPKMRNAGFCRNLVLELISEENIAPQSFLGLPGGKEMEKQCLTLY